MRICHRALLTSELAFEKELLTASNPTDGFEIRQQFREHTLSSPNLMALLINEGGGREGGARFLMDASSLPDCHCLSWLGRNEVNRALETRRAGSSNKGSLWSGQQRVCCHLPKALRLGLEEPQPSGGEERGADVSSAKLSSQGKSAANRRHWNLEKQLIQALHGTEEKAHDSKGVGVNWDSDTAGPSWDQNWYSRTCCHDRPELSPAGTWKQNWSQQRHFSDK